MPAVPQTIPPPPVHATSSVTVVVWRPAAGILATRVAGHLDVAGALAIEGACRRQVADDGYHIGFHDWEAMTDYEAASRAILTEMTRQLLPKVREAHFLVGSSIVAFGVRAANLLLRRFIVQPTRATFERALTAAIADAREPRSHDRRRF